jgi:hypothetical protein
MRATPAIVNLDLERETAGLRSRKPWILQPGVSPKQMARQIRAQFLRAALSKCAVARGLHPGSQGNDGVLPRSSILFAAMIERANATDQRPADRRSPRPRVARPHARHGTRWRRTRSARSVGQPRETAKAQQSRAKNLIGSW